ncbi:MAG: histidinol phosphate phosphatase domain-containing protein [Proteobacteria bacterium]|nr:histidinol phosphate phosphatase domain-containing protein [Pseudomonadota bacterium]
MIDLHTHSLFSDGELVPFELVRRAEEKGYKVIAICDHMDFSNMDFIIKRLVRAVEKINRRGRIYAIAGCELTHIPPEFYKEAVREARRLGAKIVVGHGETPVEPVEKGTNISAIEAGVDILAHPGLITEEEIKVAVKKGTFLEITARGGHNISNGHIVRLGIKNKANFVINTDAHSPKDLITEDFAYIVGLGAGLTSQQVDGIYKKVAHWIKTL